MPLRTYPMWHTGPIYLFQCIVQSDLVNPDLVNPDDSQSEHIFLGRDFYTVIYVLLNPDVSVSGSGQA